MTKIYVFIFDIFNYTLRKGQITQNKIIYYTSFSDTGNYKLNAPDTSNSTLQNAYVRLSNACFPHACTLGNNINTIFPIATVSAATDEVLAPHLPLYGYIASLCTHVSHRTDPRKTFTLCSIKQPIPSTTSKPLICGARFGISACRPSKWHMLADKLIEKCASNT